MPKYIIQVTQTRQSYVRVEARNLEDARRRALQIASDEDNIYVDLDYEPEQDIFQEWNAHPDDHRPFQPLEER